MKNFHQNLFREAVGIRFTLQHACKAVGERA